MRFWYRCSSAEASRGRKRQQKWNTQQQVCCVQEPRSPGPEALCGGQALSQKLLQVGVQPAVHSNFPATCAVFIAFMIWAKLPPGAANAPTCSTREATSLGGSQTLSSVTPTRMIANVKRPAKTDLPLQPARRPVPVPARRSQRHAHLLCCWPP